MTGAGTRMPALKRKKEIADAIGYAFGHWIRLEALAILAEGKASVAEIARAIGVSVPRLSGHIRGLYEHGLIEDMGTRTARNANERFYRAVAIPYIDDETYRAMTPEERRDPIGLIIQATIAETLASLRAGKMDHDENARMISDCLWVDARGREEVVDRVLATYGRLVDIKADSATRLADAGETGTTTIVSVAGFERSRLIMPHSDNGSAREIARTKARTPVGKRTKEVVDAVSYAFGYGTRVEALAVLAEGKINVAEVAKDIGVELKGLSDHIGYLNEYGCIETLGTGTARNTNKHFYRAVTLPWIPPEEYRVMSPAERRDVLGLIIQGGIVEKLAAFRHRKLETDERVQLIWDCLNLDVKGRRDVATCLTEEYEDLLEIGDRNAKRLEKSGEQGTPMAVSLAGFERSRPGRPYTGYGFPGEI